MTVNDSPLWYMRDNHTFVKLPETFEEAVPVIMESFNEGLSWGMLCTHRKGSPPAVHAGGMKKIDEFLAQARKWFESMPKNVSTEPDHPLA